MNCKDIREQLFDLTMPGAEQASDAVARHVAECSVCAAELNSLRKTMAALDEWKAPEPSPYFNVRLQARLREEKARERSPFGVVLGWLKMGWLQVRWQPVTAAALSFAIAVGVIVYQSGGPTGQQLPNPASKAAIADLQLLEKNGDVYKNFDLLYDDEPQQQQEQQLQLDENP
jgi:anti-sigma factor RsiW